MFDIIPKWNYNEKNTTLGERKMTNEEVKEYFELISKAYHYLLMAETISWEAVERLRYAMNIIERECRETRKFIKQTNAEMNIKKNGSQ